MAEIDRDERVMRFTGGVNRYKRISGMENYMEVRRFKPREALLKTFQEVNGIESDDSLDKKVLEELNSFVEDDRNWHPKWSENLLSNYYKFFENFYSAQKKSSQV